MFCDLQDFCHWEICCIGVRAQMLNQKKYIFFFKYLCYEIFTLVCSFTLKIAWRMTLSYVRHFLFSGSIYSPILVINILTFHCCLKQHGLVRVTLIPFGSLWPAGQLFSFPFLEWIFIYPYP